jgi:TatA/E family protein of Tat protein translocase
VFGISSTELLIVGIFAFIIFGPDKIPEIARTVSKAVAMFKRTQEDMERSIRAEMLGIDPTEDKSIAGAFGLHADAGGTAENPLGSGAQRGVVEEEEEDEE